MIFQFQFTCSVFTDRLAGICIYIRNSDKKYKPYFYYHSDFLSAFSSSLSPFIHLHSPLLRLISVSLCILGLVSVRLGVLPPAGKGKGATEERRKGSNGGGGGGVDGTKGGCQVVSDQCEEGN